MNKQPTDIYNKIQLLSRALEDNLEYWCPCSEYDLMKCLREEADLGFLSSEPGDTHGLFQNHFLLFHVLYQLREQWWLSEAAHLSISPLKIEYLAFQPGQQGLTEPDTLRDYYLDLSQLESTSQHDLDDMMGRFWVGIHRHEHRDEALAVLGLSEPVDDQTIKSTYQKLVMQHHPDRGGDDIKLQQLNLAMNVLKRKP